jgi:cullin-associated NEDD8-dissociated protein 1
VPALLQLTVTQSDRLYLILLSLKELISATDQLQPFLAQLLPLLFKHCDNGDEGVRAIVSECLGKLVSLNDALIIPQMLQLLSASPFVRSCMIAAVKFVTPRPNNSTFASSLTKIFALLNDNDIHVKRQAFLTLNSLIHSHYSLVAAQMPAYLPAVYKETVVHPELIREVDLGPFTRKIDDGFPLRKAAFQVFFLSLLFWKHFYSFKCESSIVLMWIVDRFWTHISMCAVPRWVCQSLCAACTTA